jgi:hypothetical protein
MTLFYLHILVSTARKLFLSWRLYPPFNGGRGEAVSQLTARYPHENAVIYKLYLTSLFITIVSVWLVGRSSDPFEILTPSLRSVKKNSD